MSTPNPNIPALPRLEIHPLRKGLPKGQPHATKVLVRVVSDAPVPTAVADRPPLDLAIVIDRSGSMSGEPLEAALGCAKNLIRGLREQDRVAVLRQISAKDLTPHTIEYDSETAKRDRIGLLLEKLL